MGERPYRTSDRRVIPWLMVVLLALFGAAYAAAWYYTGDRVARGTTIDGVRIGGLRPAAARRALGNGLADRAAAAIVLDANGEPAVVRPAAAGLTVDLDRTVEAVTQHRSWDPRRIWQYVAGGTDHDPVVRVDKPALAAAVAAVADQVDDPAVPGSVGFREGEPVAHYPAVGTVVDRPAAARTIRRAFLHHAGADDVVVLPTRTERSPVTPGAVSRAMDEFANPAMSGSVDVRFAGHSVRLQPQDFSNALSMRPVGSRLEPRLDERLLQRLVRPRLGRSGLAPRDATVRVVAGRARIIPSRDGLTFRSRDLTGPFLRALRRTGDGRTVDVRGRSIRPHRTTDDVRRLGIRERVSSFTTHFPYAAYRNVNIPRAAGLVNGTILAPGQTFSLNRVVGERTAANGFTKGYVISDGVYAKEYGGGVSQVATTTYNAAFFAGLADVEHKAHSFYISRYPVGREATVVWPDVDLRFRDNTPYGVLVRAWVDKATPKRPGAVHVEMWSTKYWDIRTHDSPRYDPTRPAVRHLSGPGCVPNHGYDGFSIDVDRLFYRHGSIRLDHRERVHTVYQPSDTVICS